MSTWDDGLLDEAQGEFVRRNVGVPELVENLSWGIVDTAVLHVRAGDQDVIVKAAGPGNHHIGREITAHESYTSPLVQSGRTGLLLAADRQSNILITAYQPGQLAEGSAVECELHLYEQAGLALRDFHGQEARIDDEYEARVTRRAVEWLDGEHRIEASVEAEARRLLAEYRPVPITVVPTHGDWQPRNWLIDGDWLRIIDFGRFAFRPAATDLCRIAEKQWRENPGLEDAFFHTYGTDPRDDSVWPIDLLREAIGTACWAFQVGDDVFEAHGHRLLDEALARF